MLSARPAMEGITPRTSVSSRCLRAASASLASRDESVVVAVSEEEAAPNPTLFLALIVTE